MIFDGAKQATELLKKVARSSSCMVAFNHIENSGWNVTIEIHNEMPDLKTMMLSKWFWCWRRSI